MNIHLAVDTLFGVLLSAIGWFLAMLHGDFRNLERHLPETYARRDDLARRFDEIVALLTRMDEKLDRKVDK